MNVFFSLMIYNMTKMVLIVGIGGFFGSILRFVSQKYIAKQNNLAGATVLRGIMSYGANSVIRTAKLLALSDDLPIIIEIIDKHEKIQNFVKLLTPYFKDSRYGGLATIEKINVIYYKPSKKKLF